MPLGRNINLSGAPPPLIFLLRRPQMLHSLRLTVVLVALLACTTSLIAADSQGRFVTRGIGGLQCQSLSSILGDAENQVQRDQFVAWIAGYLSHANRTTPGAFDVMPIQDNYGIEALAELLCRDNPTLFVETVVYEVVHGFASGAMTGPSDLVVIRQDDKAVDLRADTLKRVQELLVAAGHLDKAAADGAYGPKTRAALQKFQKSASIRETGLPDPLTLFLLFRPS